MPCGWTAVASRLVPVPVPRHCPVHSWAWCGLCPHDQDCAAFREHTREAARGPETVLMVLASPFLCSLEQEILLLWFVFDFWAALGKDTPSRVWPPLARWSGVISQAPDRE